LGWRLAKAILRVSAWALALVNFWVFSRFTVDDAFITWRYGQNLVEHGVWNYNPTNFDPTQAYTNPIFALLSVIPAFFGLNVVLFFKLLSLLSLVAFIIFFLRRRPEANLPLAIFFAVPATMIHIFGGLETFLFVSLMLLLLLAIKNDEGRLAVVVTCALLITRPEAILLLVLVPLLLGVSWQNRRLKINWKRLARTSSVLLGFAAVLFSANVMVFSEALPNTFFVKSGQYFFNGSFFLWVLAFIPMIPIALLKLWRVVFFAVAFYLPVVFSYSTSYLAMDYAGRFAFQVYAPMALLAIYVLALKENRVRLIQVVNRRIVSVSSVGIALGLLVPTFSPAIADITIYYPRLQAVHGELGRAAKALGRQGLVHVTAMGDAGLFAYESDLPNLDIRKLGTHLGAINGVDRKLVEQYGVDFALISDYAVADGVIRPYVLREKLLHICDAYISPTYVIEIWTRKTDARLMSVCENSQKYSAGIQDFSALSAAPWTDWR
jgi:hypothetical protein